MSEKKKRKSRSVLKMSHEEARDFFLKNECYCNVGLPPYFNFEPLLKDVYEVLRGGKLDNFVRKKKVKKGSKEKEIKDFPSNYEDVNYSIVHNKDGAYAWRPYQILHPAIYVALVDFITNKGNWDEICKRFKKFREESIVRCYSIPREAEDNKTQSATQVFYWWTHVEQKSIELALDFDLLYHTDVTDCYGSLYTHSIPWALHGKPESKEDRSDGLIGNVIDKYIRYMRYGQTNGISQGSVLMDFIAELVLGYADLLLTEKLEKEGIHKGSGDLEILRYRDDYRVFVNDRRLGHRVIKALSEVLFGLGMKLNSEKTNFSDSVVRASIKPDKLAWIASKQKGDNLREDLLLCHALSEKFPNSGSLLKALISFYDELKGLQEKEEYNDFNPLPLIAIVVDIASRNPRTYSVCAGILSYLFSALPSNEREEVLTKIYKKFEKLPNTGLMEVWLQRIALSVAPDSEFTTPLCRVVKGGNVQLWNNKWIAEGDLRDIILPEKVIDKQKLEKVKKLPIIEKSEFDNFLSDYIDGDVIMCDIVVEVVDVSGDKDFSSANE